MLFSASTTSNQCLRPPLVSDYLHVSKCGRQVWQAGDVKFSRCGDPAATGQSVEPRWGSDPPAESGPDQEWPVRSVNISWYAAACGKYGSDADDVVWHIMWLVFLSAAVFHKAKWARATPRTPH